MCTFSCIFVLNNVLVKQKTIDLKRPERYWGCVPAKLRRPPVGHLKWSECTYWADSCTNICSFHSRPYCCSLTLAYTFNTCETHVWVLQIASSAFFPTIAAITKYSTEFTIVLTLYVQQDTWENVIFTNCFGYTFYYLKSIYSCTQSGRKNWHYNNWTQNLSIVFNSLPHNL